MTARRRGGRRVAGLVLGLVALHWPSAASARVFMTEKDALARAFPDSATVERHSAILTAAEIERANELASEGEKMRDSLVVYFTATAGGALLGTAYFDTHRVRTLDETIMIVVGTDDHIADVQILRFDEPPDYGASRRWLERMKGHSLDRELSLKGSVHGITGATLTARAITRAARRTLAIHRVLNER